MNNMRRKRNSQRGMTLPEILVASAIFLVILVAALMMYDQSNKIFKTSVESADMQQNTRAGFDRLVADVRMAGFDADRDGVPARAAAGVWQPNTMYATDAVVSPTVANGFSYRAVTAGVSGSLEPSPWPTTAGQTFSGDGTVTWVALGPVYQQPDEQIEYAGANAITIRGNLDYSSDINREHGRENDPANNYEPAGGQFPIVTTANDEIVTYALKSVNGPNDDTLEFYADVERPRAAYPGGTAERRVQIPNVDLCDDVGGCIHPPYTLMRYTLDEDGNPDEGTAVANNIRSLKFFYFTDLAGTRLLTADDGSALAQGAIGGLGQYDPSNIAGTPNWEDRTQRAKIMTIRVELVGMNDQKDFRYTNPNEPLTDFQKYRTYTLQSLITPRNLGLSGLAEPDVREPSPPTVTSVCVGACRVTRVRWNPSATGNVDSYEVRWDTDPAGPFNNVGVVVPGDVVSAPVFNLTPGTTYHFKVVAVNENGRAISTNYMSRMPVNSTKPGPITTLEVTQGESAQENKITMTFTSPVNNDPSLANVSCAGLSSSGATIDPAETIRYKVWRGTDEDFNPMATPPEGEVVLDSTVALQPSGTPGTQVTWTDDVANAPTKPPANCKNYYYRVQVYDTCALSTTANENNPDEPETGMSTIYPRADADGTDPAIEGVASSTVPPAKPGDPTIDYTNNNSRCNRGLNTCDVKLVWPAVTADTSNPTQVITVDQYRIRRERKKASDTTWTFDTVLPILTNASSDPSYIEGTNVVYHDTTALDHDAQDRRKWYYRYTVAALQCGVAGEYSEPVQFPESCGLASSTVIESGASSGNGSLEAPWVMGANDTIQVIPPEDVALDTVEFEVFPEPDTNPNNAALDHLIVNAPPFVYGWSNQSDGQVYRVVITMTNAAGCTEQTERFIQDDPVNCPSSTVTQVGASGGAGVDSLPWIMNSGDTVTVNQPSGATISTVVFQLFVNPGNTVVGAPVTDATAPFQFTWADLTDNQEYRLEITISYVDLCEETFERFILDEPPPVCSGATITATGASSGDGALATPWLVNGGDVLTVNAPTNGIINQVVFTITPVSPAGAALPAVTDSAAPFALTWNDQTDQTVYKVDAVITYSTGCEETVTKYVQDQVCSGATVTQTGSTGAGTGLTTASPWVFDGGDTVTVTAPATATISNVAFNLFPEPGTASLSSSSDNSSPFTYAWTNRTDDVLYRLEITVTYAAGCTETIKRYIRDQGMCFITVSAPTITTTTSGSDKFATISYSVTNPTNEALTIRGIKVDWLRDAGHPSAVLEEVEFTGATSSTLTVAAGNGAPPTTGTLTVSPAPATVPANSSSYVVAIRYNLGRKNSVTDLTSSWISKLCIQYSAPSFGGSTASCNVLGATTGNPAACN